MQTLNHVGPIAKYFNLFFKLLQEILRFLSWRKVAASWRREWRLTLGKLLQWSRWGRIIARLSVLAAETGRCGLAQGYMIERMRKVGGEGNGDASTFLACTIGGMVVLLITVG